MNELKRRISMVLNPPIVIEGDLFERNRYLMAYRMMLFLTIVLFFLMGVMAFSFQVNYGLSIAIGLMGSLISFLYIRKTGRYKGFIFAFNLLGGMLCEATLFLIPEIPHLVDGLWMLVSIVFAIYTIGWRWGALFALIHATSLTIWYLFFLKGHLMVLHQLSTFQILSDCANVFVCFGIIFYLIWQNVRINRDAQQALLKTKEELEAQYSLVFRQNEEKSILLKEIHHRVKNNLQVIISLLRLQAAEMNDDRELSKFDESINRIATMALIHEKVYQNDQLSHIDIQDYFETLAMDFVRTNELEAEIELEIMCKAVIVSMNAIVPLALIFNELISNSLKYAFRNKTAGRIELRFTNETDGYHFVYSDNGTWLEPEQPNSFGLELISTLTEQLNGSMVRETHGGTKYHFNFEKLNA